MTPNELKNVPQFINWENRPGPDGNLTKVPVDMRTGLPTDAHNPNAWLTFDQVCKAGSRQAFVLTENDPFWCIDLDGCIVNGKYEAWINDVLVRFPGAFVEVSQSGTGVHIWGCGQPPVNHASVFKHLGHKVEFYSAKRFIALGQKGQGNIWLDHSNALANFVPVRDEKNAQGITNTAVSEYTGPTDDDELIHKMLASRPSAKAVFGEGVSVQELWSGDREALSRAFPDDKRPFDHNRADAALLAHLAFWTGKNGERMGRLFERSGLNRDKWRQRIDYRIRSIAGACAKQGSVYDYVKEEPGEADAAAYVGEYMTLNDQADHFHGCVYIANAHMVFTPRFGDLLKPAQFKVMYGGYEFAMSHAGKKTTRDAFEAFTVGASGSTNPKADMRAFLPEKKPGELISTSEGVYCNTYVPPVIESVEGDPSWFTTHIATMLPDARDQWILLSYMAAMIQYPGIKFRWCAVIQGVEGNGKSMLCNIMEMALGRKYSHLPKASKIAKDFNAWLECKLFIGINEIYIADRRDLIDTMKEWIADSRIELEGKGINQAMVDNCANFIACTNHKDAIIKTENDRRYAIFYCAQQHHDDMVRDGLTNSYFTRYWHWLKHQNGFKIITHYLKNFPIPDELNPAIECVVAPKTSTTDMAILESRSPLQQEIMEAVASEETGFKGGWISSIKLTDLLSEHRSKKIAPRTYRIILEELGYVVHPALPSTGLCSRAIFEEHAKRPRLYVHKSSELLRIKDPAQVFTAYCVAQGYGGVTYMPQSSSQPLTM